MIPFAKNYGILLLLLSTYRHIQLKAQTSGNKRHFSTNFATAYNNKNELYVQTSLLACRHIFFDNQQSHPMFYNAFGLDLRIGRNMGEKEKTLIYGARMAFNFEQMFLKPNFSMKIASGWVRSGHYDCIQNAINIGYVIRLPKERRLSIFYGIEQRLRHSNTRYLNELGLQFNLN